MNIPIYMHVNAEFPNTINTYFEEFQPLKRASIQINNQDNGSKKKICFQPTLSFQIKPKNPENPLKLKKEGKEHHSSFRILLQNVASLSLPSCVKLQNLLAKGDELGTDVFCLTETSANTHKRVVNDSIKNSARVIWAHSKVISTCTPIRTESNCKYGGTTTVIGNRSLH